MPEITINNKNVVFRDKFDSRAGWELMGAVRRVDKQRVKLAGDILGRELTETEMLGDDPVVDAAVEQVNVTDMLGVLTFDEMTRLIQGAVAEWDFDIDLSDPEQFGDLDTLRELLPLARVSLFVFYGIEIQGNDEPEAPEDPITE